MTQDRRVNGVSDTPSVLGSAAPYSGDKSPTPPPEPQALLSGCHADNPHALHLLSVRLILPRQYLEQYQHLNNANLLNVYLIGLLVNLASQKVIVQGTDLYATQVGCKMLLLLISTETSP
jgi:hypothetical protein